MIIFRLIEDTMQKVEMRQTFWECVYTIHNKPLSHTDLNIESVKWVNIWLWVGYVIIFQKIKLSNLSSLSCYRHNMTMAVERVLKPQANYSKTFWVITLSPANEVWRGILKWRCPSVRLSVRPSVHPIRYLRIGLRQFSLKLGMHIHIHPGMRPTKFREKPPYHSWVICPLMTKFNENV